MAAQAAPPPKDVTINEVASVLKSGFFFVTGSSSADGYPIIFSLDGVQPEPSEELQRNALIYIASLPTFSTDKNLHYCFVLDRRKSSWACVRKIYNIITTTFSRPLKEIVLLQPAGFFQKRYSLSETGKLQNEFPDFQTIALDDTESLIQRYGAESICEQLGGSVISCVDGFIQQRMSIDSLETNCLDLEERVKELLLNDIQNDMEIPNDVASTEALLNEHAEVKTNLSDEITNIKSQGEVVLQCFRAAENSLSANQQMLHIQEVQKLSNRLDDLENAITDYWDKEERKLQEFMKLREFHDEFKVLHHNLNRLSELLTNVKDYVGSVEEAVGNSKKLTKLDKDSQDLLSRCKWLAQVWSSKLSSSDNMTLHTVGPKCEELSRLHSLCTESLCYKQKLASKQSAMYEHVDQAQQWLSDDISHVPSADVESETESDISQQVVQIECQIAIGKFLEIINFEEFIKTYTEVLTDESELLVNELYQKVMDLMARYEMRKYSLRERISKLFTPNKSGKKEKQSKSRAPSLPALSFLKTPSADDIIEKVKPDPGKVRDKKNSSKRGESLGSVTSDTSSMMSSYTIEENAGPASPTDSSLSQKYHKSETDHHSESSELLSESSDQFTALAKEVSELTTETSQTPDSAVAKWRRGSIKALKARFSKKKTRQDMLDDRSDQSLNVNTGIFEKSLTMEEEKSLAKTRSKLIEDLVESERKYADELKVVIDLYMRPIAEAGDSVSTELYANQTLLFANLEELYEFSSKTFLPELIDSAGSPSLIASAFKNRVKDLSKFKEYCTSRSRAEVLLRQLANDTFLIECAQKTSSTLHSQLLLPARHMSSYNTFLQSMYSNLKDDLEAQRDTQLVLSLLSDTMQTATNLLHQVTIDGYHVDLATHGSLLHQGRVQVAHDKKSNHTKPTEFKSKLKPRYVYLFEYCLVFCKIHEDTDKPHSFMHAIKLSDSSLQKTSETSAKFVFRCNNESYLIQCEVTEQPFWYENIMFAVNNCENKSQEYSSNRGHKSSMAPLPLNSFNHTPAPKLQSPLQDDVVLAADPDVDMFDLDNDTDAFDEMTRSHNSNSFNEINGNSFKQYILREEYDNDLLLGKGDVVECVTIRRDMMQVQIPGTGIKSWIPTDVLISCD